MTRATRALLVVGLMGTVLAGEAVRAADPISRGPRELGEVLLSELIVKEGKVSIRVGSGGCTGKAHIRAQVRKAGMLEGVPQHVVTFERVGVDSCKAIVDEGVLLEYDVAGDLGITGLGMLTVANSVLPRTQDSIVAEFSLRRALKESTIQAAERALEGYAAREQTAKEGVGPAGNAERFHQKAEALRSKLAALRGAHLNDYPSPTAGPATLAVFPDGEDEPGPLMPARRQTLRITPSAPCRPGDLLEVEGTSRSGPFFHAAGGALDRLKPGRTYEAVVYLVFRREYAGRMADYDVHVAEVK